MTRYLLYDITQDPPFRRATSLDLNVLEQIATRQLKMRYGAVGDVESDGWTFTHVHSGHAVDYAIEPEATCGC